MTQLIALKAANSLRDIADLLGFQPSALSYILYKKGSISNYRQFEIPKRSGGTRNISAPTDALKLVQLKLSELLQNCMEEIIAMQREDKEKVTGKKQKFDQISHGFRRKRSIITNAKNHRNRRYVFNIDLADFFGSINFGRVRGFFIKDKNFALDPKIATILAQIACFNNSLPQGSPSSPVISNLIAHVLDVHLVKLASKCGCSYSRYADDLTFSTNNPDFPISIAKKSEESEDFWLPGGELAHLISKSGFSINSSKTRMQYCDSRQEVTGLVVNKKVNVRTEYRRKVRAMVHNLFTTGRFELLKMEVDAAGVTHAVISDGKLDELHGMLGFIDGIDLYNRQIAKDSKVQKDNISTKESMYRRFLLFKDFYAAQMPVIICEGKTDNVYLLCAIRSLANSYPELAVVGSDGSIELKVRIYRYSGTSTGRIIGINGGTGELSKFIRQYDIDSKKFQAPEGRNPIILLVDNDSGAKGKNKIFNTVTSVSHVPVKGTEPFVHITTNLYLVATPILPGCTESKIEDCFDDMTKSIVIAGKTFNPDNDFDPAKFYGKHIFAEKVVKPYAEKIDFTGFHPLLTNIAAAIDAHSKTTISASPSPSPSPISASASASAPISTAMPTATVLPLSGTVGHP